MRSFRSTLVIVGALGIIAGVGCDEPLSPCPLDRDKGLEGIWRAELINGKPIPSGGFKVKNGNFVKAVTMDFHTSEVVGSCSSPIRMSGAVLGRYTVVDDIGLAEPSVSYAALFEYEVKPGDVIFRVDTELASGNRVAPKVLAVDPLLQKRGWEPMTIVFTR